MALRLLEIIVREENRPGVLDALTSGDGVAENGLWVSRLEENRVSIKVILEATRSEGVLDALAQRVPLRDAYRVTVYPVEATEPRLEEPEPATAQEPPEKPPDRISREELYHDVQDMATLRRSYVILVALSAVVASVGLLQGNVPVLIGSMVIAPLLGPNMGLSLATALGDRQLFQTSAKTLGAGVGVAFLLALVLGFFLRPDVASPEIARRTVIGLSDVVLALASGAAGALSFTMGVPSVLVGVMVALSLLPPLAVCGLLLGSGAGLPGVNAGLLLLANVICLNLAGVLTLLAQGIHPRVWWEKEKARRAVRRALRIWFVLLILLLAVIILKRVL